MGPMYYIGLDVHKQKISYCVFLRTDVQQHNWNKRGQESRENSDTRRSVCLVPSRCDQHE